MIRRRIVLIKKWLLNYLLSEKINKMGSAEYKDFKDSMDFSRRLYKRKHSPCEKCVGYELYISGETIKYYKQCDCKE